MHASYALVLAAAACVSAQVNIGFNPVQNNEQTNNINYAAPPVVPVPDVPTTSHHITTAPGPVVTPVVHNNNNTVEYETIDCVITHVNPGIHTVTHDVISTYCPVCDSGDVYTTTYETAYSALCPTGYTQKTYTITETCSGAYTAPTGVPSGFVETVSVCNSCGDTPITATLTQPASPTTPVVVHVCPTCTEGVAIASGTGSVYPTVSTFTGAASSFSASFACGASFLAVLAGMLLL